MFRLLLEVPMLLIAFQMLWSVVGEQKFGHRCIVVVAVHFRSVFARAK